MKISMKYDYITQHTLAKKLIFISIDPCSNPILSLSMTQFIHRDVVNQHSTAEATQLLKTVPCIARSVIFIANTRMHLTASVKCAI